MVASTTQVEVARFVEVTENVRWREDKEKVVFEVSGQEFDPRVGVATLERYYNGKAYRRACVAAKNAKYDFESLRPHIVPHKDNPCFLFCWLTRSVLPLDCDVVETHINSNRFKRLRKMEEDRVAARKEMLENRRKNAEARLLAGEEFMSADEADGNDDDDGGVFEGEEMSDEKNPIEGVDEGSVPQSGSKKRKKVSSRKNSRAQTLMKGPKKMAKVQAEDAMASNSTTPTDSSSSLRAKMRKKAVNKRGMARTMPNRTRV